MAQVIVNFILQNLGDLLIQEAVFLYGVKDKVLQLQTELRMMRSYLQDADRKQDGNERLRKVRPTICIILLVKCSKKFVICQQN